MKKALLVFLLLFIVVASAFLFYFKSELERPARGVGKEVEIKEGQSNTETAINLGSKGLIRSSWSFLLYLKFKNISIKPGDYLIPANLNVYQITDILSNKTHQVVWMTVPEGLRREQVAVLVQNKLNLSAEEFLIKTEDLEGKLFPDTFKFSDQPTIDEVIGKMTEDFENRTAKLSLTDDQLILASIIEREAGNDTDRPLVAGVFANRMEIGMKLESNPTVEFQRDSNNYPKSDLLTYKFWKVLVVGDVKNTAGPYSTYAYAGLPPGPICNPGLASMKAAQNPADHDYVYFIYGNDGKLYLAKTQAEHVANVNKYLR